MLVVFLCDEWCVVYHIHEVPGCEDVLRKEEFGVIIDLAEAGLEDRVVLAVGYDEDGELLAGLTVVKKKPLKTSAINFLHWWNVSAAGLRHNGRDAKVRVVVFEDGIDKSVLAHNADGHKAVEPSVGDLFIDFLYSVCLYCVVERYPLVIEGLVCDCCAVEDCTTRDAFWH